MNEISEMSQNVVDLDVLNKFFGLSSFRRGQEDIINSILQGQDVVAVLPTGGGKSLCFQYPAVSLQKLVVVVSPLIALMRDQVNNLQRKGIASGCLYANQSLDEKRKVFADIQKGGAYILYLSPERVQKEGFQKWIQDKDIALFAIDEAHCVSQWGHDFREEYSQLKLLKRLRPDVSILALTASATPTVLEDISKSLELRNPAKMVHGFYRSNLYFQVEICENEDDKVELLLSSIRQVTAGRIIVYCGTRKVTEATAAFLTQKFGNQVGYYHAGLTQEERSRIQENYSQDKIRVLVATNAFGMGIDQPDVRLVVHFQIPGNIDALYQEMGRAGRDLMPATCLTLFTKKDKGLQSFFIRSSEAPEMIKESRWKNLDTLISYAESSECRHAGILTYYRDSQQIDSCGHCDICAPVSLQKIKREIKPLDKLDYAFTKMKTKSGKQKAQKLLLEQDMDHQDLMRFELLKKWRKEKAKEMEVPAFVIFGDQTLRQIAIKNPTNLEGLRSVYGMGDIKLEKFGWDLLAELKD